MMHSFRIFVLALAASLASCSNLSTASSATELIPGCREWKAVGQCQITDEPHQTNCLLITGFSDGNFAANGIYCNVTGTYQLSSSSKLRYELRQLSSKRWELLRVEKTKRGRWIGLAIYAGLSMNDLDSTPSEPQHLEWVGLTLRNNGGKETIIDPTEPKLHVSFANVSRSYADSLYVLHQFRSNQIDVCDVSLCDEYLTNQSTSNSDDCSDYELMVSAELSSATRNDVASNRLERARTCAMDNIHKMASSNAAIPRTKRWKVAELSYLMAHSLVKAGRLQEAIDAVLVGLANSPESRQRRGLYGVLGDLRLATNEPESAVKSYQQAFKAVKERGGAIEKQHFLSYFEDGIGDFLSQVVASQEVESIPPNYADVRTSMLIHIDDERSLKRLSESLVPTWLNSLLPLGQECEVPHISLETDLADEARFCRRMVLV